MLVTFGSSFFFFFLNQLLQSVAEPIYFLQNKNVNRITHSMRSSIYKGIALEKFIGKNACLRISAASGSHAFVFFFEMNTRITTLSINK